MTRETMSNGAGAEPRVYVIHENDAWLEPLRKEFAAHAWVRPPARIEIPA